MRLTTPSCRLGGTILARMKRWPLSGSTVGCVIGLPAFGDGPVWCQKRSRWSMPPSRCLPPTTSIEQRQNSPCHCLINTLGFHRLGQIGEPRCGIFLQLDRIGEKFSDIVHDQTSVESGKDGFVRRIKPALAVVLPSSSPSGIA